jgi:predicted dehydrogenase
MDDVIEFYGTEGVLKVDMTFGGPLSVYSRPGFGYAVEKADTTKGWTRPAVKESEALGYKDEMTHFIDCIEGRATQNKGTTAEAGFNALRIIKTLYRSHAEKRTVSIE